jgi:hypothetical protein
MNNVEMSKEEILKTLEPLFETAKKEHKWFYTSYQDMWFSPSELREQHKKDKFLWGAVNWQLRDPRERLVQLYGFIERTHKEIANLEDRIEWEKYDD